MKNKNRGKILTGLFLSVLGAGLLTAAVLLHLYVDHEQDYAEKEAEWILNHLEEEIARAAQDADAVGSAAGTVAPAASGKNESPYRETVMEVEGEKYLGFLSFTGYEITLPVYADWDFDKLKKAPARYFGNIATDTLVIAGHNYRRHFNVLNRMVEGNEVVFTDAAGHEIHYVVREIEALKPTAVADMITTDYDLTLYTCTYRGQARQAVRCERMTHAFGLD